MNLHGRLSRVFQFRWGMRHLTILPDPLLGLGAWDEEPTCQGSANGETWTRPWMYAFMYVMSKIKRALCSPPACSWMMRASH